MSTLEECCTVKIVKFLHYPSSEPTGRAIGFVVKCDHNQKSIYRDCMIPYSSATNVMTDDEIASIAWSKLKPSVSEWFDAIKTQSTIIGSILNISLAT